MKTQHDMIAKALQTRAAGKPATTMIGPGVRRYTGGPALPNAPKPSGECIGLPVSATKAERQTRHKQKMAFKRGRR